MKITENLITIRELTQDYADDGGGEATGYSGDLDIRPAISARVRLQARALDWWGKVVKTSKLSGAGIFAPQVNQKYFEPMRKIVELHE